MFEPILPVMLASSIVAHSGCVCVVYTGPWWLDRESRDGNSETSLTNSAFYLAYFGYFPDYFGLFRHTKVVSAAALALLTMAQSKRQRRCICGITGYHWGGRCSRCSRCCRAERFWCEIVRYPTVSHCISRTSGYIRNMKKHWVSSCCSHAVPTGSFSNAFACWSLRTGTHCQDR